MQQQLSLFDDDLNAVTKPIKEQLIYVALVDHHGKSPEEYVGSIKNEPALEKVAGNLFTDNEGNIFVGIRKVRVASDCLSKEKNWLKPMQQTYFEFVARQVKQPLKLIEKENYLCKPIHM